MTESADTNCPAPGQSELVQKLWPVHVSMRGDLEFSRHNFRGVAQYVIRDPISFQTHGVSVEEYQLLLHLTDKKSIEEIFNDLLQKNLVEENDQDDFCHFVIALHKAGLLQLPVTDHEQMYRRFMARKHTPLLAKLMSVLFLRVPVLNPDRFLDATKSFGHLLFSRTAFILWMALVSMAGVVLYHRWEATVETISGMFNPGGLVSMWMVLILLKVIHEFGHAYACKVRDGEVPEMGLYFILFTPCAYVDATAAWGFPKVRDRVMVSLGGVYVESIIASLAIITWAFIPSQTLLSDLLLQIALLSSIVTMGFNLNPLMRYDGYYLFSDLAGIPNLRTKSYHCIQTLFKRWILRINATINTNSTKATMTLSLYGLAASLYKVMLLTSIAAVLVTRFSMAGLVIASLMLGTTILGILSKFIRYMCLSPETQPVRLWAVSIVILLVVGIPAFITLIPVPINEKLTGIAVPATEDPLHVKSPGNLVKMLVNPGDQVIAGQPVAVLKNIENKLALNIERAKLNQYQAEIDAILMTDRVKAKQLTSEMIAQANVLHRVKSELEELTIRAKHPGTVINTIDANNANVNLKKGDWIATVGHGQWQIRSLILASAIDTSSLAINTPVKCQFQAHPASPLQGRIIRISPSASRHVEMEELTRMAGGEIAVDSSSMESEEPYVEVWVELTDHSPAWLKRGMTASIIMNNHKRTIATEIYRRALRLYGHMQSNS